MAIFPLVWIPELLRGQLGLEFTWRVMYVLQHNFRKITKKLWRNFGKVFETCFARGKVVEKPKKFALYENVKTVFRKFREQLKKKLKTFY